MHFPSRLISFLALTLVLLALPAARLPAVVLAQPGSDEALLRRLGAAGGSVHVARHSETGAVRFLAAAPGQTLASPALVAPDASPEQVARTFLAGYGQLFGIRDQERDLSLMRSVAGGAASTFVRFQQRYAGIPVLGGELVAQVRAGGVATVSGEALPDLALDTTPTITPEQARKQALAAIARVYKLDAASLSVGAPALWIFNPALLGGPGLRINTLVWRLEVSNLSLAEPVRELVLVDAQRGKIALHFNQIAEGKTRLVCDAQGKVDDDGKPNNNCDDASEVVRTEGQPATGVQDADLAYDYAGVTYDYYQSNFGRDSLDNKGLPLISLVRYCPNANDCPYDNAFWNGRQMTYGTGFAAADDVVAHELSHGFTQFSSSLFYYYQSGAINESLSDVFGELVDLTDGVGNDSPAVRWQLGEDLPEGGAVRDMKNPTRDPFYNPDRTGSPFYESGVDPRDGGTSDNGGVHSNSGVNNKALYLIVDGDTFNGQTITGIGPEKAGQIYYLLNNALLTSAADYLDMAELLPASCRALIGVRGISAVDCEQVVKATLATEMDKTPTRAPVPPEVAVCAAGKVPQNSFFDDMENAQSGNWQTSAVSGTVSDWHYSSEAKLTYASSGRQSLWGNDYGVAPDSEGATEASPGDYAIATTKPITVPANALLHFRHATDFETDLDNTIFDGGVVEYSTDGGTSWKDMGALFSDNGYNGTIPNDENAENPLAGRRVFGGVSRGYFSSKADLTPLAGKSILLRFRIGTDTLNPTDQLVYGWFVDDVRIYTCVDRPTYHVFLPAIAS